MSPLALLAFNTLVPLIHFGQTPQWFHGGMLTMLTVFVEEHFAPQRDASLLNVSCSSPRKRQRQRLLRVLVTNPRHENEPVFLLPKPERQSSTIAAVSARVALMR